MIYVVLGLLALTVSSSELECRGPEPRRLNIELLYLDMTECTRCVDAGARLDEAVALLSPVLAETAWEARVTKIHVTTEERARELRFASSPTVRINGRDIQLDSRQTICGDCGKLCKDASVTCREWRFRDQWFTSPPKALFVEAMLKAMSGTEPAAQASGQFEVPENLKRFLATKKAAASRPACCAGSGSTDHAGCCESKPAAQQKAGCCQGKAGAPTNDEPCCTLSAESRAARKELLKDLVGNVAERRDLANGVALRFKPEPGVVSRLARAIDLERDCCQFLTFGLRVEENDGPVWLEITGPASAKTKIHEYFGPK
jgi:Domain of unknown function (DUF2703)